MEQHWRPSQTAAWERLIQLKNPRTVMLYHYIESGFHTSRTRVCRVDLFGLVAALRSSKVAVLRDLDALSAAGLIAVNVSDRNLVTAYPLGSWASCVPRTGRRNIEGMLCRDYACTAVVVALSELRATAEHARKPSKIIETGTSLDNSHTNPRPLPVKDEERKGKEPLQNAPASPGHAPKETKKRKPTLAQKPPTFDDLHEYAKSLDYSDDALRDFIDYWTSMGWKRKGGPCRDARAMLRTNKRTKTEWGKWRGRGINAPSAVVLRRIDGGE